MSENVDMFVMGGCLGLGAGFALGYATRALRRFVQRHGDEVREVNRYKPYHTKVKQRPLSAQEPAFVSLPQHEQAVTRDLSESVDRSDVVAALQGLGFKKTDAARAADACGTGDRVDVESWTRAALAKAAR